MCTEVQRNVPAYVERTLPRLRRRLVGLHLRRCATCQQAFSAQRDLVAGLRALAMSPEPPPDGLLAQLLARADEPGLQARVAVPARGAVSGARPALSVGLLVAGALVGTGFGYAGWKGARRLSRR